MGREKVYLRTVSEYDPSRIKESPPKHKDLVLWMLIKTGIVYPMFRLDLIFDACPYLFLCWVRRLRKGRLS
jgi:hypothetical protein